MSLFSKPYRFYGLALIALMVVAIDQWSKAWVRSSFSLWESRPVMKYFYLTYVQNTGTAFGLFQRNNGALLLVALAILAGLLYVARDICERGGAWGFYGTALVLGGAIGNLIDRLRFGWVIDFLDFRVWPVFNIADSCISVGAVFIALSLISASSPMSSSSGERH